MKHWLVWLFVLALAAPAAAQPGRGAPGRPPQGRPPQQNRGAETPENMSPARLHQLFDAMLVMQAQKALGLSDDQYGEFVTRVKVLQDTRRRTQQQRLRVLNELQRLTMGRGSKKVPSEGEITSRLNALRELDSESASDLRRAYEAVDEILTPLQQARFRVLEDQIERRKLELVGRARNRPKLQRR